MGTGIEKILVVGTGSGNIVVGTLGTVRTEGTSENTGNTGNVT